MRRKAALDVLDRPDFIDKTFQALIWLLARPVWGLCVAWVVLACEFGHAGSPRCLKKPPGPLKSFLELPNWSPLAKLTYYCYLLHISVLFWVIRGETVPRHHVSNVHIVSVHWSEKYFSVFDFGTGDSCSDLLLRLLLEHRLRDLLCEVREVLHFLQDPTAKRPTGVKKRNMPLINA